jgi:membrane protein DedA with SNARE-associated domain
MTVFIGILSAIIGALAGTVATYLTTRSTMRRTLEHAYDRTMQEKRLERYQALFRVTKCLPRHQPPTEQEPSRNDLRRFGD